MEISFGHQVKDCDVPADFEQLQENVRALFHFEENAMFKINYLDEEDDIVTTSSQAEWEEAVHRGGHIKLVVVEGIQ